MSTMSLVEGPDGVVGAWETDGQVYFEKLGKEPPHSAPGNGNNRKHPSLAIDSAGNMLLAWTEGTGWEKGGSLHWQLYDRSGNPIGSSERLDGGIPVWGLPTIATTSNGFTLIH